MLETIQNIVGYGFIGLGLFLLISGSLGILRFPDIFSRLHAAGVSDSLGAPFIIIGLMIFEGFTMVSLKLFLLVILLMITSPTACHALAKAAYFTSYISKLRNKQKP